MNEESAKEILARADEAAVNSDWQQVRKLVKQVLALDPRNKPAIKLQIFLEARREWDVGPGDSDLPSTTRDERRYRKQSGSAGSITARTPSQTKVSRQIEITWSSAFKIAVAQVVVGAVLTIALWFFIVETLNNG